MAKTATEVEVKRTLTTNHYSTNNAAPALQEQPRRGKWLWIAAPAALLLAGSATLLVVRRSKQNGGKGNRKRSR
jgi:hypothetical protein